MRNENPAENVAVHQENGSKNGWNWSLSEAIMTIPRSYRVNADAMHIFEDSSGVHIMLAENKEI